MINEYNPELSGIENFQFNIGGMPSLKLCEIIVSFRYLGIMRDEAILSMVELARRRMLGDDLNYEQEIQKIYDELPKFRTDINSMFQLKGIGNFIK